jgi:hypothetical protein
VIPRSDRRSREGKGEVGDDEGDGGDENRGNADGNCHDDLIAEWHDGRLFRY